MAKNPKKKIEGAIAKSIEEAKADDAKVNAKKDDAPKPGDSSARVRPDRPLLTGSPKKPVPPPPPAKGKGPKQVTSTELTPEEKEIIEETLGLSREKAPKEVQSPFDKRLAELPPHVVREIMKEEPGRNRERDRARKAAERNTPEDKKRRGHTVGETRRGDIKRNRKAKSKEDRARELSEIAKAKASKFATEADIADMKYDKAAGYDAELLAPGSTPYPETAPIKPKRSSYPAGDKGTSDYTDALRSYEAALNQHNYGTPDLPWALQGIPEFLRTYTTGGLPGISYDPKSPYADKHGYVSSRDGKTPTEEDLIAHIVFLGGVPGVDDLDDTELMSDRGPVREAELYQETGDTDAEGRSERAMGSIYPQDTSVTDAATQASAKASANASEMVQDTRRRLAETQFGDLQEAVYGVGPTTTEQSLGQDVEVDPDLAQSRVEFDESGNPSLRGRGPGPQATTRQEREAARLGYTRRLLTRALNYRDKFREMERSDNTFDTFSSTEPQRSSYGAGKEGDRAYQQDLVLYKISSGTKSQLQESMEREQRDVRIKAAKEHLTSLGKEIPAIASLVKQIGHESAAEALLSPAVYERVFAGKGLKLEGEEVGLTHSEFQDALGFDEDTRDEFTSSTGTAYPRSGRQTTEVLDPATGRTTYDITRPGLSKDVVADQAAKFGAEVRSRPAGESGGPAYLYRKDAPGPLDYLYSHIFNLQESLPKQPAGTVQPSKKREGDPGAKRITGSGLTRDQLQAVNLLRKQGKLGLTSNEIFSEGVQDPTLNPELFKVNPVTKVETAKGPGGTFTRPAAKKVTERARQAGTLAARMPVYETRTSDETEDVQVPVIENDENGNPRVTGMRTEKRRKTFQSPVMEDYQEVDEKGKLKTESRQKVDEAGNPVYDDNNKPVMERIPVMGKRQKTAPVGVDSSGRRLGIFRREPKVIQVGTDKETGEPITETVLAAGEQITGYGELAARGIQQAADRGTLSPQLRQQFGLTSTKQRESAARTAERIEEQEATDEEYARALGRSAEAFNQRRLHIAAATKDLDDARNIRRAAEEKTRKDIEAGTHTKLNAAGEEIPGMAPIGDAPSRSDYGRDDAGEEEYKKAMRSHTAKRGQMTRAIKDAGRQAVMRHIERIRNQTELEFDEKTGDFVYEEVDVGGETVRRPKLVEASPEEKGASRVNNEIRAVILERLLGTPPSSGKRTAKRRVYGGKYYTGENREVDGRKIYPEGLQWKGVLDVQGMESEDIGDVSYTHVPSERERRQWEKENDFTGNRSLQAEPAINEILSSLPKIDESGQELPEKMFPEAPSEMGAILEDMGFGGKNPRILRLTSGDLTADDIALARSVRQRGYRATASGIVPKSESQSERIANAQAGKKDPVAEALNERLTAAEQHQKESIEREKSRATTPLPPVSAPPGASGYGMLPFLPQTRQKITNADGSTRYGRTTGVPVTGTQFAGIEPLRRYAATQAGDVVTENEDSPIIDPMNVAYQEDTSESDSGRFAFPTASNERYHGSNLLSKQLIMDDSGIIKWKQKGAKVTTPSTKTSTPIDPSTDMVRKSLEKTSDTTESRSTSGAPAVGSRYGTGEHQLTQVDFAEISSQLQELKTTGRQKIADQLAEAAAHGDLRENAEHDAALAEQGSHERLISDLEHKLNNHTIINPLIARGVGPGKHVTLELNGKTQTYEMPTDGKSYTGTHPRLSASSPIGSAILGKDEGHTFEVDTPTGRVSGTVKSVGLPQKTTEPTEQPATPAKTEPVQGQIVASYGFKEPRVVERDRSGNVVRDTHLPPEPYVGPSRPISRGRVSSSGTMARLGNMVRGIPKPKPKTEAPQVETRSELDRKLDSLPPEYRAASQIRQNIGAAIESNVPIAPEFARFAVDEIRSRQFGQPNVVGNQPTGPSTRVNVRSGSGRFPVSTGDGGSLSQRGFDDSIRDTPVIQSVVSGETPPPAGTRSVFLPGAKVSEIQGAIESARATRSTPEFIKADAIEQAASHPVAAPNSNPRWSRLPTKVELGRKLSPQFDSAPAKTDEQP